MAGIKISALPALPSIVTLADVYPLVQSGVTYKISLGELLDAVTGSDLVRLATTTALTVVYDNGTAGVGATLTNGGALAALSIDSVTAALDDRVLVKDQASGLQNGIYTVTVLGDGATAWVMTRATDYDESDEIDQGDMFTVGAGTTNAKTQWLQTAAGPFTMGTTSITFESNVVAGAGITKTNNSIAAAAGAGSPLTTKGDIYAYSTTNARFPVAVGDGKILQVSAAATFGIAYSTPTYPSASGSAGTLLRADGTNNVYSTSTFADTYAINTILYNASANTVSGLAAAQNGVLVSSNTNVPSMLAGPGTTGNILQSNAAAAPSFSTATYPSTAASAGTILRADGTNWVASTSTFADTYAINSLIYASAANTMTALAPALSSVMISSAASTGVPAWSGALTNGQLIIGSTGATPVVAGLTAGTGVSIDVGAGTITINASASGLGWSNIGGTSQAAAVGHGYISDNAGATTITLPATFAIGDVVLVEGLGAAGWILTANAGDTIQIGTSATSAGGTLTSAASTDNIEVVGVVANTTWRVQRTNSAGLTIA